MTEVKKPSEMIEDEITKEMEYIEQNVVALVHKYNQAGVYLPEELTLPARRWNDLLTAMKNGDYVDG